MSTALTKTETAELTQHERTIQQGLGTFREVGQALMAIRDGRLYRGEFKTFEAYCKDRWSFSRPRAYELINAAETCEAVSAVADKPTSERQVRPLSKLPKESRAEAWEEAVDRAPVVNGQPKVTAKIVEKVVAERIVVSPLDASPMFTQLRGIDRERAESVFRDAKLIDSARLALASAETLAAQLRDSSAGKFFNLKQFRARTREAKALLEETRPFAICPYCEGRKCSACAQTGVVPKEVHQQAQ
jgi:hypothetical protein